MVHNILTKIPEETLKKDLEKYRQKVLKLGISDAKIISSDMIINN